MTQDQGNVPSNLVQKQSTSELAVSFPADPKERYKHLNRQTNTIIAIFAVAIVTLIVMVVGLLLDALHFNAAVYKEHSEKIDTLDQLQATNKNLQMKVQQDQQIITDRQKQILNVLRSTSTRDK